MARFKTKYSCSGCPHFLTLLFQSEGVDILGEVVVALNANDLVSPGVLWEIRMQQQ